MANESECLSLIPFIYWPDTCRRLPFTLKYILFPLHESSCVRTLCAPTALRVSRYKNGGILRDWIEIISIHWISLRNRRFTRWRCHEPRFKTPMCLLMGCQMPSAEPWTILRSCSRADYFYHSILLLYSLVVWRIYSQTISIRLHWLSHSHRAFHVTSE